MRKKYLSALLFGALLFASAGTFTSCKDYDDDINNLQNQITANADAIKALQELVKAGKYVTAVSNDGNTITFTFNDASTQVITLTPEQSAQVVEVKDGELYIDNEPTGIKVSEGAAPETGLVKAQNGTWWVLGENGEYTNTNIPVSGVTAVGDKNEGYTLTIYAADGSKQEVFVPGAAGLITSIELKNVAEDFTITKAVFKKPAKWSGKATLPEDGAVIFTSSELNVRINPVSAPATEVEYTLTNAKNKDLSNVVLKASATDIGDGLTIGDAQGRAAYEGNGLFTLSMDTKILTKAEGEAFVEELKEEANVDADRNEKTAYAVNANKTARSAYGVAIVSAEANPMKYAQIKGYEGNSDKVELGGLSANITVDKDKVYTIENIAEEVGTLFDLYFEVSEKDAANYGLVVDELARTFKLTKRPDVSTSALPLTLRFYTLDVLGNIKVGEYKVSLSDAVSSEVTYEPMTFQLTNLTDQNKDNDAVNISMSVMKEAMGEAKWQEWFNATALDKTVIEFYTNEACTEGKVALDGSGLGVTYLKADGKTVATDAADLATVALNVAENATLKANKQYYAKVTFNNGSKAEVNNIVVPVIFKAPVLADLFEIASGYWNSELETVTAYFRNTGNAATGVKPSTVVKLTDYFTKAVTDATISALSTETKVGETDKTEDALFDLANTDFGSASLDFDATNYGIKDGKPANGYGQILNLKVVKNNYAGWEYADEKEGQYAFNIRMMSPIYEGTIKVTNNQITINGNDLVKGAKITDDMIKGADYNTLEYSLMPGTKEDSWETPQVADVTFDTSNAKYIKDIKAELAKDATDTTPAQAGYFKVTGQPVESTASEVLPIKVTDKWGLVLEENVTFNVVRN